MEFKNICIVCNSNFISKSFNRKTCSDECKQKHLYSYKKEYMKDNKDMFVKASTKYYEKNKEKISKKKAEEWIKKTNREELTDKGKKAKITKEENKRIMNLGVDSLLQEFGNIE